MSPDAEASGWLRGLLSDLYMDLEALAKLRDRLAEAEAPAAEAWPPHAQTALLAISLHGYYGAVEAFFTRVARVIDASLLDGPDWHRTLLSRMARPLEELRPALISASSHELLRRLLGFRHFFRHAYAVGKPVGLGRDASGKRVGVPRRDVVLVEEADLGREAGMLR